MAWLMWSAGQISGHLGVLGRTNRHCLKKKISSPLTPLLLGGFPFDQVHSFKYLGVLWTCDLTWSSHTQMVCNKARKILGVLHRRFYNAPASTLFQLYLSIVHPHLEYASPVWSLHLAKDKELVEGVQKFVLRVASKNWTMTQHDLLDQFNLSTLEIRRCEASLTILFKIIYKICFFPDHNYI